MKLYLLLLLALVLLTIICIANGSQTVFDPLRPFVPDTRPLFNSDDERIEFESSLKSKYIPNNHKRFGSNYTLTPYIIVPSMVGSVIEARLENTLNPHWLCPKTYKSWFYLWFDYYSFLPLVSDCWTWNVAMHFNKTSGFNYNRQGVYTRVPDWGGVGSIEYLDSANSIGLWNDTIKMMQSFGYEVNQTLFGAPYDWRAGPNNFFDRGHDGTINPDPYYYNLKQLIEYAYKVNNGTKVALTSLSEGAITVLLFLQQYVTQEWKDKHIAYFVSLDGAIGGSVSAIATTISSTYLSQSLSGVNSAELLSAIQTMGGVIWLFPNPDFYGSNRTYISNPLGNFTASNLSQAYGYINANISTDMYNDFVKYGRFHYAVDNGPGIEVYLIFGNEVKTPIHFTYNTSDNSYPPEIEYGNGDGTVMESGLRWLERYSTKQYPVYSYPVTGMIHGTSLRTKEALDYFFKILFDHEFSNNRDVLNKK